MPSSHPSEPAATDASQSIPSPSDRDRGKPAVRSPFSLRRWLLLAGLFFLVAAMTVIHGLPRLMPLPPALRQPIATPSVSPTLHSPGVPPRSALPVPPSPEAETIRVQPYHELPASFLAAMIATQDPDFWTHGGTDGGRVIGAIADSLTQGRLVSGGTTITQQLAKITATTNRPRSAQSWLVDALTARRIELSLSKEDILAHYCARLPFGNGHTGLAAAAEGYFQKTARDLTLAESAFLAGLPDAPTRYDPYRNFNTAKTRQKAILDHLAATGQITVDEARQAAAAKLRLRPAITRPAGDR